MMTKKLTQEDNIVLNDVKMRQMYSDKTGQILVQISKSQRDETEIEHAANSESLPGC